jgi:hypothetical protein
MINESNLPITKVYLQTLVEIFLGKSIKNSQKVSDG